MRDARGEQHGVFVVPERVAVVLDDYDHLNFLLSGVNERPPRLFMRLCGKAVKNRLSAPPTGRAVVEQACQPPRTPKNPLLFVY
jgi:hypothetical protein